MKKILLISMLAVLALASCKDENEQLAINAVQEGIKSRLQQNNADPSKFEMEEATAIKDYFPIFMGEKVMERMYQKEDTQDIIDYYSEVYDYDASAEDEEYLSSLDQEVKDEMYALVNRRNPKQLFGLIDHNAKYYVVMIKGEITDDDGKKWPVKVIGLVNEKTPSTMEGMYVVSKSFQQRYKRVLKLLEELAEEYPDEAEKFELKDEYKDFILSE